MRLAALLESARAEARSSGVPARWEPLEKQDDGSDFRFVGLSAKDPLPTRWLETGTAAQVIGARAVVLGPEPLIGEQRIVLRLDDQRLTLVTDGHRPVPGRRPACRQRSEPSACTRLHPDRGAGRARDRRGHARRRHQGRRLAHQQHRAPGRDHRRPVVRRQPAHRAEAGAPLPGHRRQPVHLRAARPHLLRQADRAAPRRTRTSGGSTPGSSTTTAPPCCCSRPSSDASDAGRAPSGVHADRGAGRHRRHGDHVADGLAGRRRHRPGARFEPGAARADPAPGDRDRAVGAGPRFAAGNDRGAGAHLRRPERAPHPPRRGRDAGGRLVAAPRQQRQRDVAALGRTAGDDHDRAAGGVAAHPAVPGQRGRPPEGADRPRPVAGLLLPGQRLGELPVDRQRRRAASAPERAPEPRAACAQALPSGVRLVLAFAPGSGLNGSLVRDTLLASHERAEPPLLACRCARAPPARRAPCSRR